MRVHAAVALLSLLCMVAPASGQEAPAAEPSASPTMACIEETAAAFAQALASIELAKDEADGEGRALASLAEPKNATDEAIPLEKVVSSERAALEKSTKVKLAAEDAPFVVATRIAGERTRDGTVVARFVTVELIHRPTLESRAIVFRAFLLESGKRVADLERGSLPLASSAALTPFEVNESAAQLAKLVALTFAERPLAKRPRVQLAAFYNRTAERLDKAILADAARAACSSYFVFLVDPATYGLEAKAEKQAASRMLRGEISETASRSEHELTISRHVELAVVAATGEKVVVANKDFVDTIKR